MLWTPARYDVWWWTVLLRCWFSLPAVGFRPSIVLFRLGLFRGILPDLEVIRFTIRGWHVVRNLLNKGMGLSMCHKRTATQNSEHCLFIQVFLSIFLQLNYVMSKIILLSDDVRVRRSLASRAKATSQISIMFIKNTDSISFVSEENLIESLRTMCIIIILRSLDTHHINAPASLLLQLWKILFAYGGCARSKAANTYSELL